MVRAGVETVKIQWVSEITSKIAKLLGSWEMHLSWVVNL